MQRSSNFELLRIISIFLIILHHFSLSHMTDSVFIKNAVFSFLCYPGGLTGVGLFFMITGYFMCFKNTYTLSCSQYKKILSLVAQMLWCAFFCLIVFAICKFSGICSYPDITVMKCFGIVVRRIFCPVSSVEYWFITAYILLFILSPVLNGFISNFGKHGFLIFILFQWIFWYTPSIQFFFRYHHLQRAVFYYSLGAFFRLYVDNDGKIKAGHILKRFFTAVFCFALWCCFAFFQYAISTEKISNNFVEMFLEIFIVGVLSPAINVIVFNAFLKLKKLQNKAVNLIAQTTFSVYLLHGNQLLLPFWFIHCDYNSENYIAMAVLNAVYMFALCSAIDLIRVKFFRQKMNSAIDKFYESAKRIMCKKN